MKRIIYLIFILSLFTSCGAFRRVFKSSQYSSIEVKSESKRDSLGVTVDKTITTIRERSDSTITIPAKSIQQPTYLNKDSLVNGMMAIQSNLVDVKLKLDPVTGILTTEAIIHPQSIPVKFDKTTTIANDISRQSKTTDQHKGNTKSKKEDTVIDKEPIKIPSWLQYPLYIFIAVAIWYWWSKRGKN